MSRQPYTFPIYNSICCIGSPALIATAASTVLRSSAMFAFRDGVKLSMAWLAKLLIIVRIAFVCLGNIRPFRTFIPTSSYMTMAHGANACLSFNSMQPSMKGFIRYFITLPLRMFNALCAPLGMMIKDVVMVLSSDVAPFSIVFSDNRSNTATTAFTYLHKESIPHVTT